MSGTSNSETCTNSPRGAAGSSDGGHRHLSRGDGGCGRPRLPTWARWPGRPWSTPNDASKATAEREAPGASLVATDARAADAAAGYAAVGGAGQADEIPAAAPEPEVMPRDAISAVSRAADSVAWRAAAISVAALDRIEAAAAKVETDIAAALQAQAELRAGAGAAAEAAVRAALSARPRRRGRGGRAAGKDQPAPGQAIYGDHLRPGPNHDHCSRLLATSPVH